MVLRCNNSTIETRRICRQAAGAHSHCPVIVVAGDAAPEVSGESGHYETSGGRRIYHPSAYSRRGWSNMRYVASTYAVYVGQNWLNQP